MLVVLGVGTHVLFFAYFLNYEFVIRDQSQSSLKNLSAMEFDLNKQLFSYAVNLQLN